MAAYRSISFIIISILSWTAGSFAQRTKCTLNNGRCTYRVQLLDTCENDLSSTLDQIGTANDDGRIAQLEEKIAGIQGHYSKKIADLEQQISVLTDFSDIQLMQNTDADSYRRSWDTFAAATDYGRSDNEISKDGTFAIPSRSTGRPENSLLMQVHGHFTDLRDELEAAKRRLAEKDRLLQNTQDELSTSRDILTETEERATSSQMHLTKLENEKDRLQAILEKKAYDHEQTSRQAGQCERDLEERTEEVWRAQEANTVLRNELGRCHRNLDSTTRSRDQLLNEHHELRRHHANLTEQHNQTRTELAECTNSNRIMATKSRPVEEVDPSLRNQVKTASFCGFEDPNLCGYTNEAFFDDIDWRQFSGPTPTSNTGPSHDHTCENNRGKYVFVSASNMARDLRARLMSPKHLSSGEQCIEFYYFMYGGNVGILNVYFLVDGWEEDDLPPPVWRAYGNQGNMWIMARLSAPLDVVRGGYRVVFEARTQGGYEGDIALDDVRVYDGPCGASRTLDEINRRLYNNRGRNTIDVWP